MSSLAHPCLEIQTDEAPHPSIPAWFAETVLIATALRHQGRLSALAEQVRLTRGRFGHYEVIDFLAVLFAYAALARVGGAMEVYPSTNKPAAGGVAQAVRLPLGVHQVTGMRYPFLDRAGRPAYDTTRDLAGPF